MVECYILYELIKIYFKNTYSYYARIKNYTANPSQSDVF